MSLSEDDVPSNYSICVTPSHRSSNVPAYSSSVPTTTNHLLFLQQRAECRQNGRLRATSWTHRRSLSYSMLSLFSDDSAESTCSPEQSAQTCDSSVSLELQEIPKRSILQLFMNCMFQFGSEFLYATETALVTPILLQLGLPNQFYSITWLASPILGFLFTPLIGSASDKCHLKWGRRRPFILTFCIGVLIGVTLLLNGGDIGVLLGDTTTHTIGMIITLFGIILLDFSTNSGDCPARAYLIDVCRAEDAQFAFTIRTLLGGLGGGLGYLLNGIDWETTVLGVIGPQERIIFTMCAFICIISFTVNLVSIPEVPLEKVKKLRQNEATPLLQEHRRSVTSNIFEDEVLPSFTSNLQSVQLFSGKTKDTDDASHTLRQEVNGDTHSEEEENASSISSLFLSIVKMPKELYLLCFNHFLGWLAFLVVLLFFTDYMAQAVYKGDPTAPIGSAERLLYDDGVKMGCWGLCIFQFSCAVFAAVFTKISSYISLRTAYVFCQLTFAVGTGCMALLQDSVVGTLVLCSTFGIQFFTILTVPTCLVAHYHESEQYVSGSGGNRRGIGTDVACIGVQIFIAQIINSTIVGPLINLFDSHLVIVLLSSFLAFCSATFSALCVLYDVEPRREQPGTLSIDT